MTALSFELDPTDAAVVAALKAPGNLGVYVGSVTASDTSTKTISAPLPYVLYGSALPFTTSPRLGGSRADTTEFTLTYVNQSSDGAKAVAAAVRALLDGLQLGAAGRIRLRDRDAPVVVRQDLTWTRPGGLPLFFALDRYSVA